MANPKYELTITCKSPRSPQSTGKISKETGDARENVKSMNSNIFDEFEYGNESNCINSNIRNDSFATTKVTLKNTVDQILIDDPAQIMEVNESFDLNSGIQGSLCSQCKFTNRLNSYIERAINSSVEMEKEFQEYFAMSETSSFSPAMNGTVDLSESVCDDKTKSVTGYISPNILNSSYHSIGLQNSSFTPNLLLESNRPQISEQYLNETEKTALELDQSLTKNSVEICNGKSSKDQFTCKRSLTMSWNSETCLVEFISSKKTHFHSLRKFKSEDNILVKLTGSKSDSRNKFSVLPDKFMSNLIEGFGLIPFIKGNHSPEIIKCNENVSNALTLRQSKNKCLDDWNNDKVNTENSQQFSVLLQTDFEKLEDIKQGEMGMDFAQTYRTSKSISFESSDIFLEQLTPSKNLNVQDTPTEDSSSTFNQSTIEEMYFMDSNDNIDCSSTNEKFQILPQHETNGNDSLQCTLNDKMIRDTSTTEKLVDLNLQQLANSTTQPIHEDSKKNNITVNRDSGSIVATIDSKTGYNEMQSSSTDTTLKSDAHLSVIQLKVMRNEEETTVKAINLVNPIDDPGKSSESLRDQQLGNEKGLEISSNSFLELSIESQMDTIREKDTLGKKEIVPIHINNSITSFTTSQNLSVENVKTRNRQLAVLNTVNINADGATINLPDNVNTEFMIREKLNRVEKEDERTLEKRMLSNLTDNLFPNVDSPKDENIGNTNRQTSPGDFSLDMLSESQLQTIETEAYVKAAKIDVVQLKKATTEGGVNKQNIFFKPEQTGIITTDKNDLVLPNWVTNRAPEPDYDKMRRAFQNRRQYVKILLQEILRLSTIVSKVGAVLRAEHAENNLKPHVDSVDEATICETLSNTKTNVQTSNNAVKDLKNKNIFYVPPSNMPFPNIPQDFPNNINNPPNSTGASMNTVTLENSVCTDITTDLKREKFYVPTTNKSKYDTLPLVNQQMDTKFKDGQITEAFVRHNASNMFGSLKQISNNHKTYKPDVRSIWHSSGQESGSIPEISFSRNKVPKNNQTVRQQIAAGYEMPQSNLNASIFSNNTVAKNVEEGKSNICDLDHSKLANKNTIFYVPDEGSSVSGDYVGLGSIKNDPSRSYKFSMPSKSQTRSNENSKLLVNDILAMNTQKAQSNRKNLENLQLTVKNDIFYSPDESSVSNNTLFTSKFAESSGTKSDQNFFYYANFPMPSSSHPRPDQHLMCNVVISNKLKRKSNIHDVNNAKRARENTTFYSPEKLSIPSKDLFSTSDYMEIRDTTNPSISSRNCSLPSSHVKLGRPLRLLNNTAVFYNGNKDQETGFRKLYRH
ncbi:serine-rich adhesin for platelets-like [Neodiprion pinetum]|uniref:serine-rich adhesin for platelets-like n=1 Tax=Neodiprion pinetum TaxID=441929 RepID=UPI00372486BC